MNEKIETPTPWPFAPGQIVRDSGEGDDAAWLDAAPVGTAVQNAEGCEWTRGVHGWFGAHPSWATSADLVEHGPLTVVSVPDCCDHLDMEQGHCYACYDSGHAHDPERPCPPAATLHDCAVDETAGGAETTGAVEAAAEAILEACYGQELPEAPIDLARAALTAALDVDEMARVLAGMTPGEEWPTNEALGGSLTGTRDDEFRDGMRDQASALRAAILGGAA